MLSTDLLRLTPPSLVQNLLKIDIAMDDLLICSRPGAEAADHRVCGSRRRRAYQA